MFFIRQWFWGVQGSTKGMIQALPQHSHGLVEESCSPTLISPWVKWGPGVVTAVGACAQALEQGGGI